MEAKASGRYLKVTPRKARYVLDEVRGKSLQDALGILKFVPNEAARFIEKVLNSAAANAENNYAMDRDILKISSGYVDVGRTRKHYQPRAKGQAYRILHRTSHITVGLSEDEALRKVTAKPKVRKPRRGGKEGPAAPVQKAARTSKPKTAGKAESAPTVESEKGG